MTGRDSNIFYIPLLLLPQNLLILARLLALLQSQYARYVTSMGLTYRDSSLNN
jgi:hypothetical protein